MATIAICGIVTDAMKDNINLIFAARGLGPATFTRKLCAINPLADFNTPATHWLYWAAAGSTEELVVLHGMQSGDLPLLPGGAVWGENGVITAQAAMAASNLGVFSVYSAADNQDATDFLLGTPDGNGVRQGGLLPFRGLQYVPDPPL